VITQYNDGVYQIVSQARPIKVSAFEGDPVNSVIVGCDHGTREE
jgi:hypothetical protein